MAQEQTSNPRYHADNIKKMLSNTIDHIHQDERQINDRQAKALFETTAEVLTGLVKAFNDYEQGEPAWK